MSWSNFIFDINTPKVTTKLTTNSLQYDNYSTPIVPLNCNMCQADNSSDDPCQMQACPTVPSCPQTSAFLLAAYPSWKQSNNIGCCTQCPYPESGCCSYQYSCLQAQQQFCGNFNGQKTCTLGVNGKGFCQTS